MCIELLVFPMLADLWYGCIKCDDPFSVLVNYFSFSFKYSPLVSCLYVSAVLTHVVLFLFSPAMCFCLFMFQWVFEPTAHLAWVTSCHCLVSRQFLWSPVSRYPIKQPCIYSPSHLPVASLACTLHCQALKPFLVPSCFFFLVPVSGRLLFAFSLSALFATLPACLAVYDLWVVPEIIGLLNFYLIIELLPHLLCGPCNEGNSSCCTVKTTQTFITKGV